MPAKKIRAEGARPEPKTPVVLAILDGWGLAEDPRHCAISAAATPVWDRLTAEIPPAPLAASGEAVGLPPGQMGNSEVGHLTLGAGRAILQTLPRIDRAVETGDFFTNPALEDFFEKIKKSGGAAHILGLLSDGGVHAHFRHFEAAAEAARRAGIPAKIHAITDGRDTAPGTAADFLKNAEKWPGAEITTISGRFFALDRDRRWDRVARAFAAIARGDGARAGSVGEALEKFSAAGETDEFFTPTVVGDFAGIRPEDGIFFANFRADRARELGAALFFDKFSDFDRGDFVPPGARLTMAEFSPEIAPAAPALFPPEIPTGTLGEKISAAGLRQFRIAETEKFAHISFFFSGGREAEFAGETRVLVPSPRVKTYDEAPEMAAAEVAAKLSAAIRARAADFYLVNFANPDMVGHTGDFAAAVRAIEATDRALGEVLAAAREAGAAAIVTADHGNAEKMRGPDGAPHTAHTLAPVPAVFVGADGVVGKFPGRTIAGVAGVVAKILGI